ncbi:stage II sporulation protein P [Bacillus salipaludis]|uniref:Stage II sporulation protein P n=1 Tax=Bacillus salipaludis TaxID=2547811 RepID=A0A4R5VUT0_9BACI|nr:stage II sporulation protein P [Bacillus salipaludis]TDK61761.1 stage II sporulation protein P [Bacillus salipaludis]
MQKFNNTREKKHDPTLFFLVVITVILFIWILNSRYSSDLLENLTKNIKSDSLYVTFINSENHAFAPDKSKVFTFSKISSLLFLMATNLKPTDARTYLVHELPGLAAYDTQIVVAGEGTNLTTLPFESSPPEEVLLHERQVSEEELNKHTNKNNEENIKLPSSPKGSKVFIYNTHNLESYLPLLKNTSNPNQAISSDPRASVVGLGKELTFELVQKGISAYHDTTNVNAELLKKGLKYSSSYEISHQVVQAAVSNNPNIKYFIDIHRDSSRKNLTTKVINGESYAKISFIVGRENKNYKENEAFTKKLYNAVEQKYPGLCRGVFEKSQFEGNGVYNQDISNRAILVEVGGVDNNLDELDRTISAFGEVFADVYWEENKGSKE